MSLPAFAPITDNERHRSQHITKTASHTESDQIVITPIPASAGTVTAGLRGINPNHMPQQLWGYTDAKGSPLFFVGRWDHDNGHKHIRPIAWARDAKTGREAWKFRHHPDPRPIYNLHNLAQRPDAPVIIFEGEAKCEVSAKVFPQSVATTSAGGAMAAHKADWSPLAGRKRVLIWPDANDKQRKLADGSLGGRPGEIYAANVAGLLMAHGVDEILIIDAMRLASTVPNSNETREPPQGWDIKDAVAEGWQPELLRAAAVAYASPYKPEEPKPAGRSYISFSPFTMSEQGLHVERKAHDDEATKESVFVCAPFEILGRARDTNGNEWAKTIRWRDHDGREHIQSVKESDLVGDGVALAGSLMSQGLTIARSEKAQLLNYLSRAKVDNRLTLVSRTGWHGIDGGQTFVLPTINNSGVILDTVAVSPFEARGSADAWRDGVGALVCGHARAVLAVSLAFSGPLLRMVNAEGGGLNLFGQSSRGKSTLAQAAASVWGKGSTGGFVRSWRTTANASEAAAAVCSDTLLVLDELGVVEAKEAASAIYSLANGQGKGRSRRDGQLRQSMTWRVPILSTGEIPMAAKVAEDRGKGIKAGQQVRLLDIAAESGKGFGCFDHGGPDNDAAKLSNEIKREAETNYGTAGPRFVERIKAEGFDRVAVAATEAMADFVSRHAAAGADGQVQRVAQRLALIAVAGELAAKWSVVPWPSGEATMAAKDALDAWVANRGGSEAAEVGESLTRVRLAIQTHGASRFENLEERTDSRPVHNRLGYTKGEGEAQVWMIPADIWRSEICVGLDPKTTASVLADRGFLEKATDGNQKVVKIRGQSTRCYVVTAAILAGA